MKALISKIRRCGKPAACMAVLGTGSDVGKSIVVTALCRIFAGHGLRVAPFKAQNMSNNSGVTPEGLEMGRAQIVQAEAARTAPHVDMNPILLKPTSEVGAQVVVRGVASQNCSAAEYHCEKQDLFETAGTSLDRLRRDYDLVIMEGAGSCAEVNLMAHDIVNLPMAAYADAAALLVGDIHRGGVFAQIVGTLACLPSDDRRRIRSILINRFRGDIALFSTGCQWIENKTGRPVVGVLPWFDHIHIDAEDSVVIEKPVDSKADAASGAAVAVIRLPHIANFTDFEPLARVPGLQLVYLQAPRALSGFAAVILPGSKNTRADLAWLESVGWSGRLKAYAQNGGHVLGICGGFQMLGRNVHDPHGLEGRPGSSAGLGLLPVETTLQAPKTTSLTRFSWGRARGSGYEIHMGTTRRLGGNDFLTLHARNAATCSDTDGCTDRQNGAMGTYLHGFFDNAEIVRKWLAHIGLAHLDVDSQFGSEARQRQYDLLASHFEKHIDLTTLTNTLLLGEYQ